MKAWSMMGGLDWQALPIVVELLGIHDPENLINRLIQIRDHKPNANP